MCTTPYSDHNHNRHNFTYMKWQAKDEVHDIELCDIQQVWQKKLHKVEQLQLPQHKMQGALLLYVVVREGSEKNRHLKETKIRTSQKAKNEEDIF